LIKYVTIQISISLKCSIFPIGKFQAMFHAVKKVRKIIMKRLLNVF